MHLTTVEREDRPIFAYLLALAMAQALIVMVPAWAVQQLFDSVAPTSRPTALSNPILVTIFVFMAAVAFAIEIGKRRLAAEMALRHARSLRMKLFERQLASPGDQQRSKGAVLLPFVGDLTAARRWVGEGLARGASALILIPVMLTIIAIRSPGLAAALGAVLALSLAASAVLARPLNAAVREVRKRRGILTNFIAGRIEAAATIQASGRAIREMRKVTTRTEKLSAAERRRAWVTGATRGVAQLTNSLLVLTTLVVGMAGAARGETTPGEVAAILSLVGLMSTGVTDVGRAIELWQPAKVSYERIRRVLRSSPARPPRNRHGHSETGLEVTGVRLEGTERPIDLSADRGEIIAIEGPAASGKSAMLATIAQLRSHTHGAIRLDGHDLAACRPSERARLIGLASTDMGVLPGTLGMNLRYRSGNIDEQELLETAYRYGLGTLIERLPQGLDSKLRGENALSAGERQALSLVRAILGQPTLLLLDAVDTHLDKSAIGSLARDLRTYPGIVIMVASRRELLAVATRRWRIAEAGEGESANPEGAQIINFERPA